MRDFWVYDWEVYYNFNCVTFIHTSTPKVYIEAYKEVDIMFLEAKRKWQDSIDKDQIQDIKVIEDEIESLKEVKAKLLVSMNTKTFFNYRDTKDKAFNICQLAEIRMFFTNHKVLLGYNSYNYDSLIDDYILINSKQFDNKTGFNSNNIHITQVLKEVSDEIINVSRSKMYGYKYPWKPTKYHRLFEDYDIQRILYLDKTFVGLKSVMINLRWHRIQELPLPPESIIQRDQVWDIYDYNVNDTLGTRELLFNQEEEVTLREEISERYDINVLNQSRSSIGKRLMSKYYEEESGIPYKDFKDTRSYRGLMSLSSIITDRVHFVTDKFKDFLSTLKKITISPSDTFERKFECNGTHYNIAKGGIHSIDDSRYYNSLEDGYIYEDADVTSYYPSILIIFAIYPAHLIKEIFLKLIKYFKDDRVRAKKAKLKLEAEALKIVINRIYGALKDINDYLFDPKATYQTTMNGQLSLLMLIEKLEVRSEGNIHVISANTDGIVSRFKPEYQKLYDDLCAEWQKETEFELEFTYYEKYVRNNVNEYLAIKKGFNAKYIKLNKDSETYDKDLAALEKEYVKGKGALIFETPFNKGFIHPVVSLALKQYILYNISYIDTIKNHWKLNKFNIYDYCISQKVDKKYNVLYKAFVNGELVEKELQQYNRFFVVKSGGGTITKDDEYQKAGSNSTKARSQSLIAHERLEVFNDYHYQSDYNIDFNYYIHKVERYLYYRKKNPKGNHKYEGLEVRGKTLFD